MTSVMVQPAAWSGERRFRHIVTNDPEQRPLGKFWTSRKHTQSSDMSLLKFLAINALELSAPASPALLQTRGNPQPNNQNSSVQPSSEWIQLSSTNPASARPQSEWIQLSSTNPAAVRPQSEWIQLSGHPASIAPSSPGAVCKRLSYAEGDYEAMAYRALAEDPLASRLAPAYLGERTFNGDRYIELEDLLHGFRDPHVMDVKMGRRTFLESEVGRNDPRPDLYRKMCDVDPGAPTAQEHAAAAVTKMRYMTFREELSSSQSKGFRIEALKVRGSAPLTDLKRIRSHSEVTRTISFFLASCPPHIASRLLRRLREMRELVERSEFFATHEVVGSSVFVAFDDKRVGAWLIDFAKARRLPEGVKVDHRRQWTPGNHEEGFLHGLDQLIEIIEEVHESTSNPSIKNCSSRSATLVS